MSEVLIKQVRELLKQGQVKIAIQLLETCLPSQDFDVLHWAGVSYLQNYQYLKAIKLLNQAVTKKTDPLCLYHLAQALHLNQQKEEAITVLLQAIELEPDFLKARYVLGQLYIELEQWQSGLTIFLKLSELKPELSYELGMVYQGLGEFELALTAYTKQLSLFPLDLRALFNSGVIHQELKDFERALFYYQELLSIQPNHVESLYHSGLVHQEIKQFLQAKQAYLQVLEINPNHIASRNNLGLVYQALTEFSLAQEQFMKCLDIQPDYSSAYNNLGNIAKQLGHLEEAIKNYQQAIELSPLNPVFLCNLGNAYKSGNQPELALRMYDLALEQEPNHIDSLLNSGLTLRACGLIDEAIETIQKSIELAESNKKLLMYHHLLFSYLYQTDLSAAQFLDHCQPWNHLMESQVSLLNNKNYRKNQKRIKLAYLSPDFRNHSAAFFYPSLFKHNNRELFDIYIYSDVFSPDGFTFKFKELSENWRDTHSLTDSQVSELIQNDSIDILVEPGTGFTLHHRFRVFAACPAPLQITLCPTTSGLKRMDYRVSTDWLDPEDGIKRNNEKLLYLPHTVLCYQPPDEAIEVSGMPALDNDYITFGSFNHLSKINPEVIRVWSQILIQTPRSKLILKNRSLSSEELQQKIITAFSKHGIGADRLKLLSHTLTRKEHLELYHQVDIALDPFPYNGHTTTCEALWMGVPVMTLKGKTHFGRVASGFMHLLNLDQWIAEHSQDYIQKIIDATQDIEQISHLRHNLRERLLNSQICDSQNFIRQLEKLYSEVWKHIQEK